MKIVKLILSVLGISLAGYGLVTGESTKIIPYTMMFLGAYMLVLGIEEFKRKQNSYIGYIQVAVGIFAIYVSYQSFITT
ncbi:hypothetical protein BN982_02348 [Halobacillus karajensis]|uniref:DUF3953 domain-containing protein n=1 Tax=Halobacillus karajensis TaxID=195088 RepID=A0A024P9C2_9BACI|nr:hypothetical protein BN982_02348 [Halobacillus karajensis]CDQ25301.1 hypothetical protein BN983_03617 [Halobacillus karajensis]CDQ28338.1 hypothetical protein BN981_02635 [Halobacillus karajensis]